VQGLGLIKSAALCAGWATCGHGRPSVCAEGTCSRSSSEDDALQQPAAAPQEELSSGSGAAEEHREGNDAVSYLETSCFAALRVQRILVSFATRQNLWFLSDERLQCNLASAGLQMHSQSMQFATIMCEVMSINQIQC
jgi:hypothetical protein